MTSDLLRKRLRLAWRIAVAGVLGVNLAHFTTQRIHRSRDYCQLPFNVLKENQPAIQLLGGEPLKLRNIDLSKAEFSTKKAKLVVPVRGKETIGFIHTLSNRPDKISKWKLQYAVMRVSREDKKWNVWLHPDDGIQSNIDLLPNDVKESLT